MIISKGMVVFGILVGLVLVYGYLNDQNFNSGGGIGFGAAGMKYALGTPRFKVAYSPEGDIEVIALASPNALAKYRASEGNPIPEARSMVVGSEEGADMKKEKLFSKPGDRIYGFFGITTAMEGVLAETGSYVDYAHFLGDGQFQNIQAQEGRVFLKLSKDGQPKLFYRLALNESLPMKAGFAEGSMDNYKMGSLSGSAYYPVILGAKEASVMREEKLFSAPGDTLRGFFGRNVVVVGVLGETGTIADFMHFAPLGEDELG